MFGPLAIAGLFAAIVVTVALTALGSSGLMQQVVEWLGLQDLPGMSIAMRVASVVISYLKSVVTGPAGATFGPVLGLMVFAYISARMILFATAWAATAGENLGAVPAHPPPAARITPRVQVREGMGAAGVVLAAGVGALGALGLSRLIRRR